jgi:predicted AlkP superfamily pyrophosphatase or phosphodiesterase
MFRARRTLIFFLAAFSVFGLFSGCAKKQGSEGKARTPLFVFCLDGLEWRVLKPLLEAGRLPAIAGLMERGSYGYLSSMQPTFSAVIWTSIATGKTPEKHGIRHFVYEESVNGKQEYRYFTSGHRRTKAMWNILSERGLVNHTIGWWMTYPAEPVKGIMVSQTNTTGVLHNPQVALWKGSLIKGVEEQVYPPDKQARVMELLAETDAKLDSITAAIFGTPRNPVDDFSQMMWDQTEWAFRADATYVRVARDILETQGNFDVFSLYLGGTDVAAHRFWRYAFPGQFAHPPDDKQIENFGRVLEDSYVYADRVIGEFTRLFPDAAVLVLSDHGMHSENVENDFSIDDPPLKTTSAHHLDAPPGVLITAGGPFKSAGTGWSPGSELDITVLPRLGSVLDVLPTILAVEGIPVGEDMDGAPMRSILDLDRLDTEKVRSIPTHDDPKWLAGQTARIRHAVDERERIEQLRSLGYIK